MPWPEKQRQAIFLRIKRTKGEAAARAFMRKHGHGGETDEKRKRSAKRRARRKQ